MPRQHIYPCMPSVKPRALLHAPGCGFSVSSCLNYLLMVRLRVVCEVPVAV